MPKTTKNQIQAVSAAQEEEDRQTYILPCHLAWSADLPSTAQVWVELPTTTAQHRRRKTDLQTVMPLTVLPSDAHRGRAVGTTHLSELVTQGPVNHVASVQQELPQCESVWWTDGKEREMKHFGHYEERWNWRFKGGEE